MKTTLRGIAVVAAMLLILALIGHALSSHGQTDAQPTGDAILQPVAPENVPDSGTFFYLLSFA